MSNDDAPKVKVFASDDNLKSLGELLSNDSSRSIIYNLMTKDMYTNEISTKLDMRVSLVIHHLKKLEDLGLLEITEKKIKRKGIDHRFFKIKSNIFVVIDNDKKEIEEKGLLKKIFNEGIKFTSVMVAACFTWFSSTNNKQESITPDNPMFRMVNGTTSLSDSQPLEFGISPIISTLVVIACFIFVIWFTKKYR